MTKTRRVVSILTILIVGFGLVVSSWAEGSKEGGEAKAWPAKSIQIVAPYNPGGDTDFNARVYAKYMTDILGVPVVVTNVTGSGGTIGARRVLDADADGYTVLWHHSAMLVSEAAGIWDKSLNDYDFACIGAKSPGTLLYVSKDSPYNTFEEIVAASKANPNSITFAGNTGATTYLAGVTLNAGGAKFNIADFGGGSDRLAAVMGGHVDIIPNAFGMMKDYIDSGDVKALATLGSTKVAELPDVPTVAELGFADATLDQLYFFAFPKGTPSDIVEKWTAAVKQVSEMEDYQDEIQKAYFQKPYFVPGAEGLKEMNTQRDTIMKYKDLLEVH